MGNPFTATQIDWLVKNHDPDRFHRDLTAEFNRVFGENRSVCTIKHKCHKLGLGQHHGQRFTAEQDKWFYEHQRQWTIKETTERFNKKFQQNRTEEVIKVHCNRELRICFKNDHVRPGAFPIGGETLVNGRIYVKVSEDVKGAQAFYQNWKPKAHVVWELHHGTLPETHRVCFLDGNTQNCDISNLYAVHAKVLRMMNKNKWFKPEPERTLTAIKWCELHYAIKEVKDGD